MSHTGTVPEPPDPEEEDLDNTPRGENDRPEDEEDNHLECVEADALEWKRLGAFDSLIRAAEIPEGVVLDLTLWHSEGESQRKTFLIKGMVLKEENGTTLL